jgi:hypothetical protein
MKHAAIQAGAGGSTHPLGSSVDLWTFPRVPEPGVGGSIPLRTCPGLQNVKSRDARLDNGVIAVLRSEKHLAQVSLNRAVVRAFSVQHPGAAVVRFPTAVTATRAR